MKLFSAFAAAELLERDRQTITRALRSTPPDGQLRGAPRWKMSTVVAALEVRNRPNCNGSGNGTRGGVTPELAVSYALFDRACKQMGELPTLEQRRAATKAMVPMIRDMDRKTREVGLANGQDDDFVHLRSDKLLFLYMRGFEEPCAWTLDQCWEHLCIDDDAE